MQYWRENGNFPRFVNQTLIKGNFGLSNFWNLDENQIRLRHVIYETRHDLRRWSIIWINSISRQQSTINFCSASMVGKGISTKKQQQHSYREPWTFDLQQNESTGSCHNNPNSTRISSLSTRFHRRLIKIISYGF